MEWDKGGAPQKVVTGDEGVRLLQSPISSAKSADFVQGIPS